MKIDLHEVLALAKADVEAQYDADSQYRKPLTESISAIAWNDDPHSYALRALIEIINQGEN